MRADLLEVTAWLNAQGFVINNVCQLHDGKPAADQDGWRVNARRTDWATTTERSHEYGDGKSLEGALRVLVERLGGKIEGDEMPARRSGAMLESHEEALARATATLNRLAPVR